MYRSILLLACLVSACFTLFAQSPGNALDFDGGNDKVDCPLPGVFDSIPSQDITVEAWIFPRQAAFQRIMYAQQSATNFFNFAYSTQQHIFFYVNDGTTHSAETNNALVPGTWHHVACRWTAATNTVEIFVNGVLQATSGGGSSSTGTSGIMSIGSRPGGAQFFNGQIDELRIWRVARSDCDIAANYNAEFSGPQPNLVAYYDFNQGMPNAPNPTVTTLNDQSGNNLNGTLTGFTLSGPNSNWVPSTAGITVAGPSAGQITSTVNVNVCPNTVYTFPDGSTQTITTPTTQVSFITGPLGTCDSSITTNVGLLQTFAINETDSVCTGGSYTFPDGTTQNNITAPTVYTSQLSSADGCDSIVVTSLSLNPIFTSNDTAFVCQGDSFVFPDGSVQTNIMTPTVYTSLLSTGLGCDSTIVTFLGVNQATVNNEADTVCSGSDYTFPDGSTQTNITAPTTYTSLLADANGCDSTVVTALAVSSVDTSITVLAPGEITANQSNATYQWLDCNNGLAAIPGETQDTFLTFVNGLFAVAVTVNGCTDTSGCLNVIVVGLEDQPFGQIQVYPNPTRDQLQILHPEMEEGQLAIFDLRGKQLLQQEMAPQSSVLSLGALSSGTYILKISHGQQSRHLRILKE